MTTRSASSLGSNLTTPPGTCAFQAQSPMGLYKEGSTLRFIMTDGQQDLPVSYVGVVPDSFKAGGQTVVEGKLDPEGTFQATTLLAKCPSKYEPDTAPAG